LRNPACIAESILLTWPCLQAPSHSQVCYWTQNLYLM